MNEDRTGVRRQESGDRSQEDERSFYCPHPINSRLLTPLSGLLSSFILHPYLSRSSLDI